LWRWWIKVASEWSWTKAATVFVIHAPHTCLWSFWRKFGSTEMATRGSYGLSNPVGVRYAIAASSDYTPTLLAFSSMFSHPVWYHVPALLMEAILCLGPRTVPAVWIGISSALFPYASCCFPSLYQYGKQYLSAFLLSLNLLTFLSHTVLEWSDGKHALSFA
jgi:hypothetical protein